MDFYKFINSKDIREYHQTIGYQYNAVEAAWLVSQCRHANLEKKHEAWQWIIDNMPDMKIGCVGFRNDFRDVSIHEILRRYMEMQNRFLDEFKTKSDRWVYTYRYSCECSDGERNWYDVNGIFSSWDKCFKYIFSDSDLEDVESVRIYRVSPDEGDHPYQYGYVEMSAYSSITDVDIWFVPEVAEQYGFLECVFDDMWFAFPVPFKKGDIVHVLYYSGKLEPIVIEGIVAPPGRDLDEFIKFRKEHGGDSSDMNIWGYAVGDFIHYSGVYNEVWWNYMDVEYYRKELVGRERALIPISAWLKGEMGDDVTLLLAAYHRAMLEEAMSQTVPCLYTKEGLKKAGLPEE